MNNINGFIEFIKKEYDVFDYSDGGNIIEELYTVIVFKDNREKGKKLYLNRYHYICGEIPNFKKNVP